MTHQILLNFGQNLDKIDMKQLKKVSPQKSRAPENPRKPLKIAVF
jgi:hypothetical protein